jgi:4-diphosphocytidyl-2-C-methyl-D-erythritol kinase
MVVRQQTSAFEIRAFAKINLFLEVVGREAGRHLLRTIFYSLPLHDTVCFRTLPRRASQPFSVRIHASGPYASQLPDNVQDNIVFRILSDFPSDQFDYDVVIDKQIPVAGGLAGGSADGAAAIAALVRLGQISAAVAGAICARYGSDLNFAYSALTHTENSRPPGNAPFQSYAAIGTHFGEKLQPISSNCELPVQLKLIPQQLSTAAVFQKFDEISPRLPETPAQLDQKFNAIIAGLTSQRLELINSGLYNALRPAAALLCPILNTPENQNFAMTGSGPTLFSVGQQT